MSRGGPSSEDQRRWMQMELERERTLKLSYSTSGVCESVEHAEWVAQYRNANGFGRTNPGGYLLAGPQEGSFPTGSSSGEPSRSLPPSRPPIAPTTALVAQNDPTISHPDSSDPTIQHIHLHSVARAQWCPVIASLDTGTEDNWISQELANRMSLQPLNGKTAVSGADFSGSLVKSLGVVQATWYGEGSRRSRFSDFQIAPNGPFDVVFGSRLLLSEGVMDFNKHALILVKTPNTKVLAYLDVQEQIEKDRIAADAESIFQAARKKVFETREKSGWILDIAQQRYYYVDLNLSKVWHSA